MSQTATATAEAPTNENADRGVLSINGNEIEFTRNELVNMCNGLSEGRRNARSDDRPLTGDGYWDLRAKISDALDK